MNRDLMFSSKTGMWATPQDFFDKLDEEFHFGIDVCATPENAKCSNFFTEKDNGLLQNWGGARNNLVQSTIRQRSWEMGQESLRNIAGRRDSCNAP